MVEILFTGLLKCELHERERKTRGIPNTSVCPTTFEKGCFLDPALGMYVIGLYTIRPIGLYVCDRPIYVSVC